MGILDSGGRQYVKHMMSTESRRIWCDEYTDPAAADVDALVTAYTTSTAIQVFSGATLDGIVGAGTLTYARNVTLTLSSHTDWDATTGVVVGTDIVGRPITENFTIPNNGNTTVVGAKCFLYVTSITIPAQTGTGGTATFGFGALLGLTRQAKVRAGTIGIIREIEAGVVVTTGTFAVPATGLPFGSYSASNAPNGSRDYALYYELDELVQ